MYSCTLVNKPSWILNLEFAISSRHVGGDAEPNLNLSIRLDHSRKVTYTKNPYSPQHGALGFWRTPSTLPLPWSLPMSPITLVFPPWSDQKVHHPWILTKALSQSTNKSAKPDACSTKHILTHNPHHPSLCFSLPLSPPPLLPTPAQLAAFVAAKPSPTYSPSLPAQPPLPWQRAKWRQLALCQLRSSLGLCRTPPTTPAGNLGLWRHGPGVGGATAWWLRDAVALKIELHNGDMGISWKQHVTYEKLNWHRTCAISLINQTV